MTRRDRAVVIGLLAVLVALFAQFFELPPPATPSPGGVGYSNPTIRGK